MSACDYVHIPGLMTAPLPALQILWRLEERGVRVQRDGDDLLVGPRSLVTDEDREAIRQWKRHLLVLATLDAAPCA